MNWTSLRQALHPDRLLPSFSIGLTTGAIGIVFDLSYVVLIFSGTLASHVYCPKPVIGGLLLFLGLSLLQEWVYASWFKLSKCDYLIVQLIWLVSGTVGFLQGLMVGWAVATILVVLHPWVTAV